MVYLLVGKEKRRVREKEREMHAHRIGGRSILERAVVVVVAF